jgi:hypothetical protein
MGVSDPRAAMNRLTGPGGINHGGYRGSPGDTVRVRCDGGWVELSPGELLRLAEYGLVESPFTLPEIHGALTGDLPEESSADDE